MSDLALTINQTRFEVRTFFRNRSGMTFTFLFPIMFLLVFGTLNHGNKLDTRSGLPYIQFFVPGILAFGILSACYTALGIRVSMLRDNGVLKRMRGTPLPAWAFMAGQIGCSIVVSTILSAITVILGVVLFGMNFYAATLPGLILMLVLGGACFCALGLAITGFIANAEAAPAIMQFTLWPILFVSDVFYPLDGAPSWLQHLAGIFPIKPLANGLQYAFDPSSSAPGINIPNALSLAAWTMLGIVVALRKFRWESKTQK